MNRPISVAIAIMLFGVAACGENHQDHAAEGEHPATVKTIRGHYLFGHEVRALRPCGGTEDLWVIDDTGLLADLHERLAGSLSGEPRLSVIATGMSGPPPGDGFGADYPSAVTIHEVVYAALEGFGCDFDLTGFVYRAFGNEPFWSVEVKPDTMVLRQPGSPDLTWSGVTREVRGDEVVLSSKEGKASATLTIKPGPGFDSMSGAYLHHRARFETEGILFQGVALRGLAHLAGDPPDWRE
jgi:uncharacterized membrane protein